MFIVDGGRMSVHGSYNSYNTATNPSYAVRPVIEIDLSTVHIGATGTGADVANAYSISAK